MYSSSSVPTALLISLCDMQIQGQKKKLLETASEWVAANYADVEAQPDAVYGSEIPQDGGYVHPKRPPVASRRAITDQ